MQKKFVTQKEASRMYSVSGSWLQHGRSYGFGPPFIKVNGKILYNIASVDKWFQEQTKKQ